MVQNSEPKRRGRPPAYDADLALARALETFWTGGFAATSLDDLSAATGMNRPSLYGAFGDKRALFLKALMSYRARGEGIAARLSQQDGSLRQILEQVYAAALDIYLSGNVGGRGCFLTGAALAGAVLDVEVRDALLAGLEELDRSFVALFRKGQRRGEVAPEADPEALGLMASAILHTLSVRARAGAPRSVLERVAASGTDTLVRAAAVSISRN